MARILSSSSLYTWRCVALPTTTTHGNPESTLKILEGRKKELGATIVCASFDEYGRDTCAATYTMLEWGSSMYQDFTYERGLNDCTEKGVTPLTLKEIKDKLNKVWDSLSTWSITALRKVFLEFWFETKQDKSLAVYESEEPAIGCVMVIQMVIRFKYSHTKAYTLASLGST